jgi:hypothetical protein
MSENAARLIELTLPEYTALRAFYFQTVHAAVFDYLSGEGNIVGFENKIVTAIDAFFPEAANMGWSDGAGEGIGKHQADAALADSAEASTILESLIRAEKSYAASLATRFRGIRSPDSGEVAGSEAAARAEGYARTLDRVYANFKVMAVGGVMLTFDGDDGEESCTDCQRYKGQRHRAWWWVRHDAVPPNRAFECGGYKCYHFLRDDQGNLFTI